MIGHSQSRPRSRQSGAVLIVAMIFLIVLTLLAVSGITTTSLEEKMASNTQETTRALSAAETALTEAQMTLPYGDPVTPPVLIAEGDKALPAVDPNNTFYEVISLGPSKRPLLLNDPHLSSADKFGVVNFDVQSRAMTEGGVVVVLHGGIWQEVKK